MFACGLLVCSFSFFGPLHEVTFSSHFFYQLHFLLIETNNDMLNEKGQMYWLLCFTFLMGVSNPGTAIKFHSAHHYTEVPLIVPPCFMYNRELMSCF